MRLNKNYSETPTISIIVPVYQVEPYIRTCLDSILMQSFTDWEMLLVDDGSTDGSERVCDEYAIKDERIRVFHQENRGLSAARNTGLNHARGSYIAMIDSDDLLLSPHYLHILYHMIIKYDAQVSVCKRIPFENGEEIPMAVEEATDVRVYSGRELFTDSLLSSDSRDFSLAYEKLYHRSCFDGVRYPVGRIMEDSAAYHRLLYPCERIVYADYALYGRRFRPGSIIMAESMVRQYVDSIYAIDDRINYLMERDDTEAVSIAKKVKLKFKAYYYFEALKRGVFEEFAEGLLPDISEFDKYYALHILLNAFKNADPSAENYVTVLWLSKLVKNAAYLLSIAKDTVLGKSYIHSVYYENDTVFFTSLAMEQGLLPIVAKTFLHNNKSNETNVIQGLRQPILNRNAAVKIREALSKEGILPYEFKATKLIEIYPALRLIEEGRNIFLVEENDVCTLQHVMKQLLFHPERPGMPADDVSWKNINAANTYSSRDTREKRWTFQDENRTIVTFSIDEPFIARGKPREYIRSLCAEVKGGKRAMTLEEHAVFLVAKLHRENATDFSATLSDLLYLMLIILYSPEIKQDPSFLGCLKKLDLLDTWTFLHNLCEKIMDEDVSGINLDEEESSYILYILGWRQ